ncbi:uncharacterized protein LOC117104072 [Anneissia japonica]|uniref:uncharacterized protein LOC117104072 n=1 Tax=Anneissia japonica TaxID=1529436 RepID=UPI001425A313|nr:uncharacterized protein LOC117104072 [Anneissia japonica]
MPGKCICCVIMFALFLACSSSLEITQEEENFESKRGREAKVLPVRVRKSWALSNEQKRYRFLPTRVGKRILLEDETGKIYGYDKKRTVSPTRFTPPIARAYASNGVCNESGKMSKRPQQCTYLNGRMVCNINFPLPARRSVGSPRADSSTNEVGKRVSADEYQETLPERLEDFVAGIPPDDGVCRIDEAFQLLSKNWQDIIILVLKLGLTDVGSERK